MLRVKRAVLTTKAIMLIILSIALMGAGIYFVTRSSVPRSRTATTTTTMPQTLTIDDYMWPSRNLNQLYGPQYQPWPNWMEHATYQPLITTNITEQYQKNIITWIPDLATSWTISQNATEYVYNLRQGIKFSNGDTFNSFQVWTEFMGFYYLSGNSSSFLGNLDLFDFSHVDFGQATLSQLASTNLANPTGTTLAMMQNQSWPIYAAGPYQIVFHLRSPFLFFNGLIGGGGNTGLIFDAQYVLNHGGFGTPGQINSYFDDHPIPGTGPYIVTDVILNSQVTFIKNPTYWGDALSAAEIAANPVLNPGQAETVIINIRYNDNDRYDDLSTGQAQIASIFSNNWNLVANNTQYAYFVLPDGTANLGALAMNTQLAPTDNVWLRRAIVHAINYTEIIAKAYVGQARAFIGPETPNYGHYYNPANLQPYNLNATAAKADLVMAGYPNGVGLQTLNLRTIRGCGYCVTAAQVIQGDLAKFGITVNIELVPATAYWNPYGSYQTNLQNANKLGQLSFLGGNVYYPDYLSPTDYWVGFTTNSSSWGNWAVYNNARVDQDVSILMSSANQTQQVIALADAERQIYSDAPYAWICTFKLWNIGGSIVWNKNTIQSMLFDPNYGGTDTAPIINTVTFV